MALGEPFHPEAFDYIPRSFILPAQLQQFKHYQLIAGKSATYIAKPLQGSQGDNIVLFKDLRELQSKRFDELVVQRYINNPYLLNGLKFDIRLYIIITGTNEGLTHAFLADEGLVRFCTTQYEKATPANF